MAEFKQPVDEESVASTFAIFAATGHVVWIILVNLIGQSYVDWITGIHGISTQIQVKPFDIVSAVTLVLIALILGYIVGFVFAKIWNWVVERK